MAGTISIDKLNPHPKNGYYFTDIDGEKYEEVKRSIATYGIRDALKITTNYTIISGHQRFRIAKDLGLTEVPVIIMDVDEWEAEYMLIAENTERRGEAETDPIKKARIAKFLTEYWDVKHGGNRASGHNGHLKTTADIAEALGESEKTTRRLIKLNDLIPELQQLISDGKLGTTAGEQLAYLTEEAQRELWGRLGEGVGDKTVKEVTELRRQIEDKDAKISELETKLTQVKGDNTEPKVIEKIVEVEKPVYKEVVPEDIKRKLVEAEEKAKQAELDNEQLSTSLSQVRARLRDLEQLERTVQSEQENPLYRLYRNMVGLEGYLESFVGKDGLAEILVTHSSKDFVQRFTIVIDRVAKLVEQANFITKETLGENMVHRGSVIDTEFKIIKEGV